MSKGTCIYNGVSYSEGAEICQAGRVKICEDGKWVDQNRPCSEFDIKEIINKIPMISEEEARNINDYKQDDGLGEEKTLTRYAIWSSVHKDFNYLYFTAAKSVGSVCAQQELLNYKTELEKVITISEMRFCTNATAYVVIVYDPVGSL